MKKKKQSSKKNILLYLLWLFLGCLGAHRFYMKKYLSAIIMLMLTIGLLIYYAKVILRVILLFVFVALEADLLTTVQSFFLMIGTLLSTGLIVIVGWWLIDLFVIYKFTKEEG